MQILCDSVHIFKHAINIFETLFRITHHVTCYQFFIVEIIVENVNKMMSKQIRKFYHHDGEQLGFYEKIHIKTQSKRKRGSRNLYIARNEEFQFISQKLYSRER